jgi:hypothetical protein
VHLTSTTTLLKSSKYDLPIISHSAQIPQLMIAIVLLGGEVFFLLFFFPSFKMLGTVEDVPQGTAADGFYSLIH